MNNPLIKLGLIVVVLIGGSWFGISAYRHKTTDYEHRLDLERIRQEFLERAPLARLMESPEKYRYEEAQLLKWYFNELNDHYNRFQGLKDYDRFLVDLDERKKTHKIKEGEYASYAERFKATKELFERLRTGKYDPVFTAGDKGLRFDIYEVQPSPDPKEPKLRLSYALWGAQRKWAVDSTAGLKVTHLNVSARFHEMVFSGLDADGKEIRKMSASGDPYKIDHPERFIDEFPPGLVFGYFEIPKIPSEVVTAELTYTLSTRSVFSGEEVEGKFVWKQPLPSEWKLPPGAGWEGAQEQVREDPEPQPDTKAPPKKGKK
jgi:hypothetical protein